MTLPLEMPTDRLQRDWPATRAEALARLDAFVPRMGRHYHSKRNDDFGPEDRSNVSMLSPYLRRRMVTEEKVLRAALARHGLSAAEKFVQEVVWRGYWKGWLEMRPGVWARYRDGVVRDRDALAHDRGLMRRLAAAEEGRSGIEAFDAWAAELVETGYLHNHARMWFASIWIFTLGLPWRLGADFFLRHFLDGDAASNTLGWRWVAGLHTRGKCYAAAEWNIRKFTGGRLAARGLAEDPEPLAWDEPPGCAPIRAVEPPSGRGRAGLLLCDEDLGVEMLELPGVAAVATLDLSRHRSGEAVGEHVARFDRGALDDALARLGSGLPATRLDHPAPEALADWARDAGLHEIVSPYIHVGWVRDWIEAARPALDRAGVAFREIRRPWDDALQPHATAGFFKVKGKIPEILRERGLAA